MKEKKVLSHIDLVRYVKSWDKDDLLNEEDIIKILSFEEEHLRNSHALSDLVNLIIEYKRKIEEISK